MSDYIKDQWERGDLDISAEKILRRWLQNPETLEKLLQSIQEEPVLWGPDDEPEN
jgi:hypothetical protein